MFMKGYSGCVQPFVTPWTDCNLPGSFVCGILQARIVEWFAISYSRDLSNPGIKPMSPALASGFFTTEPPGKSHKRIYWTTNKLTRAIYSIMGES